MRRLVLAWVVVMGLVRFAGAQAPGETEPMTAVFLEKRVPDELATEGVVLSRSNLGLRVEQLADKWLVSLADLTTGRVAASTKVDVLPDNREAAVAVMTHVVAELAAQVVGRAEPPPAPEPAPAPSPSVEQMLRDQQAERAARAEREQREAAELQLNRRLIRFNNTYEPMPRDRDTVSRVRWSAYQGDPDQKLDPQAFYKQVGRPDLAEAYTTRRNLMVGSFVGAGVAFVAAYALLAFNLSEHLSAENQCFSLPFDQYQQCLDQQSGPDYTGPLILFGLGTIGIGTGIYYALHRQPIDEAEARALGDAYNQRLRGQSAAPALRHRSLLRDVGVTPYVTGRATGLVVGARF